MITSYLRLLVLSYFGTEELLHKAALLNKSTRAQLLSKRAGHSNGGIVRFFAERAVKLVLRGEECARWATPRYILEFADRLTIQSVMHFKGRAFILEALLREVPQRMNDFRVRLFIANDLPTELINQAVKSEMKFSEVVLFNVTAEYSDRLDQMLKSSNILRLGKCHFRQIFPKEMTNDAPNEIEVMQMDEVDFQVKNTILRGDKLQAISLSQTALKPRQLEEVRSTQIQTISLENQILSPTKAKAPRLQLPIQPTPFNDGGNGSGYEEQNLVDCMHLINRQTDLRRLNITANSLPAPFLNQLSSELPSSSSQQLNVSLITNGEACSLDEVIQSKLLDRAADTFIACERLREGFACMRDVALVDRTTKGSSDVKLIYKEHSIVLERIGLYCKATIASSNSKGEMRIVCRN